MSRQSFMRAVGVEHRTNAGPVIPPCMLCCQALPVDNNNNSLYCLLSERQRSRQHSSPLLQSVGWLVSKRQYGCWRLVKNTHQLVWHPQKRPIRNVDPSVCAHSVHINPAVVPLCSEQPADAPTGFFSFVPLLSHWLLYLLMRSDFIKEQPRRSPRLSTRTL